METDDLLGYVNIQKDMLHSSCTASEKRVGSDSTWKTSPTRSSQDICTKNDASCSADDQNVLSQRATVCLFLWYFFSFTTLFLNKYILSYAQGEPTVLGSSQLLLCSICGYVQLQYTCGIYKTVKWERSPQCFYRNMLLVGSLRFSTLFLGLIALWYVPVSFAETVKSSAPVFTVILAWILMGEKTSLLVVSSLTPVMGGLALCSANEISFNFAGFVAAMSTNLSECLQNVYSKKLLSGDKYSYSPPELQFYTSISSVFVQVPALIVMMDVNMFFETSSWYMFMLLFINGLSFHCQSMTEYTLLGYISPVTHSVANTVKRALMIWLSILVFGNKVTFWSGLGTAVVIFGVFGYNKARHVSPSVLLPSKEMKNIHKV